MCGNFNITVNLANKDCEVPFDILLACLDKQQDSRVPNESLFSELAVKIRQHFLNLNNSRAKVYKQYSQRSLVERNTTVVQQSHTFLSDDLTSSRIVSLESLSFSLRNNFLLVFVFRITKFCQFQNGLSCLPKISQPKASLIVFWKPEFIKHVAAKFLSSYFKRIPLN